MNVYTYNALEISLVSYGMNSITNAALITVTNESKVLLNFPKSKNELKKIMFSNYIDNY